MSNVQLLPGYETELFCDVYDDVGTFLYYYGHSGIPTTISQDNARILYYLLYGKYGNSPIANYDVEQFKCKINSIIWQYGPTWEKRLDIQNTLRTMTEADLKAGAIRVLKGEGDITTDNTGTKTNVKTGSIADAHTGTIGDSGSDTYNNYATAKTGTDIHNHAYNPETGVDGQSGELSYINEQNIDKWNNTNTTTGSVSHANTKTMGNTDTTTFTNVQDQVTDNLKQVTTNDTEDTDTLTIGKLDAYQQLWDMLETDVTAEFLNKFNVCFKKFVLPRTYLYVTEED